ncbi:MAG: sigma-54 dependent transcriptional regulator [Desulfarculaceae bacterium]
MLGNVLIVDEDRKLCAELESFLADHGQRVELAHTGEEGLEKSLSGSPDLVILAVRLPDVSGLDVFRALREVEPKLPVIFMTAYGTTEEAIQATKLGAFDYVLKPFKPADMLTLSLQALEVGRLARSPVELEPDPARAAGEAIIGRSQAMQELYKAIGRTAPTDATVLIRGESGVGKELAARALYQHSLRADKPFIVINCVAIPESLLESELFGYEKGAFTGAVSRHVGKIEQAGGGTIFLDEIGDMPLTIQAKILRLLQEKSVERLGGRREIPVDVRIIAATNRDLEKAVAEDRFREDLYYRLNVVTLDLPPLRERMEDVQLLADYFLARYAREMGVRDPGIAPEARPLLAAHPWPGNVRELANAMEKCLIFSRGRPISPEDVAEHITGTARPVARSAPAEKTLQAWVSHAFAQGGEQLLTGLVEQVEQLAVAEALRLTGGNRLRAAKLLGISRPTLLARIDKYGLRTGTTVGPA